MSEETILLARLLKPKTVKPANTTALLSSNPILMADHLSKSPDLVNFDKHIINIPKKVCDFLATADYQKVIMLYHGNISTLDIEDDGKGTQKPTGLANLLTVFQEMKRIDLKNNQTENDAERMIKGYIREIELLSCLVGSSCITLFEIAKVLNVKELIASNLLRGTHEMFFDGPLNNLTVKTMEHFRPFIVFGPNDQNDIKKAAANNKNKLAMHFFCEVNNAPQFKRQMDMVNLKDPDGAYEIRLSLENFNFFPVSAAYHETISTQEQARIKQEEFIIPRQDFYILHFIPFPPTEPRRGPNP